MKPTWTRGLLLVILSSSAVLYTWNLRSSGFSDYYATAVKSMSISSRAFLFGAFDPGATITLDKLSGFLVPQALSVELLGYTPFALSLPQAIEGLITVIAVFWIGARWLGPVGGLVSAAVFAFTPLLVSVFSHPMEDALLTMFTALSVVAWQRAVETDRTRWLVLAGFLVGLGFQAKMMQSWLVLPAFAVVFFLVRPANRRRALVQLAIGGAVAIATSVSWMIVINSVPASRRPYIDGTTDNNIFSMVFGYNGLNHFIPGLVPGSLAPDNAAGATAGPASSSILRFVAHTPIKLLFPEYATQVGWLYPLVLAGIVLGIVELPRVRRGYAVPMGLHVAFKFCLALLVTVAAVLAVISLPHTAYLASLALPLAILCAIAAILLWRAFRLNVPGWKFALPVTVAVEIAWTAWLLNSFPFFSRWIVPLILTVGLTAAIVLFILAMGEARTRLFTSTVGLLSATLVMAAPAVWSVSTLNPMFDGSANDAYAGPIQRSLLNPPLKRGRAYGSGLNSNRGTSSTATLEDVAYDYAAKLSPKLEYVLATDAWRSAAPMIMDETSRVLPIGGFTSRAPTPTRLTVEELVHDGSLRFILLTGTAAKNTTKTPGIEAIQDWTRTHCQLVSLSRLDHKLGRAAEQVPDHLYDCGSSPRITPRQPALHAD